MNTLTLNHERLMLMYKEAKRSGGRAVEQWVTIADAFMHQQDAALRDARNALREALEEQSAAAAMREAFAAEGKSVATRYRIETYDGTLGFSTDPDPAGEWIRFEDYEKLRAALVAAAAGGK